MSDRLQIVQGLDGLRRLPPGSVLSVGNFDGVHLGHQRIVQTMRALAAPDSRPVVAVTFEPHPLTVLRPQHAPPRLTPPEMKRTLLGLAGIDVIIEVAPSREVLDLSAEQFWGILRDQARPRHMVEGALFNFGKGRGGTIDKLRAWAAGSDISLHVIDGIEVPLLDLSVVPVSSSLVRWLVGHGRVRDAAICLGRAYVLRGSVVRGEQRGRSIGVPTANLETHDQLIPADGVYAAQVRLDGECWPVAANIGLLPTFSEDRRQIEAHLIGFEGDLYGKTVDLELVDWLRDQRRFQGIPALKAQIQRDIAQVMARRDLRMGAPIAAA
jgi:riboflavin kinase/FMN adenylyltransferase